MPRKRLLTRRSPDSDPPKAAGRGWRDAGVAYRRLHDTLLAERGVAFEGTPARTPEDIANYITHAAFCRIENRPVPGVLGRPGIARHAWFATAQAARKMAGRHVERIDEHFFGEMAARVPPSVYGASENIIESGRIGPGQQPYIVFAAKAVLDTGQFFFSGIVVADRPVFVTVFRKVSHGALYKALWTGARQPRQSLRESGNRSLARLVRRYQLKIRDYPDICIDFFGSITPEAALMGHSLFRHLRRLEMARLKALPADRYGALRRQVTAYAYPRFGADQRIHPLAVFRAGVRRSAEGALVRCKRSLGRGRAHA